MSRMKDESSSLQSARPTHYYAVDEEIIRRAIRDVGYNPYHITSRILILESDGDIPPQDRPGVFWSVLDYQNGGSND